MPEVERVDPPDAMTTDGDGPGGFGSLGSIVLLVVLTWAAGIATFPLNDNSFFTHLATGRLILDRGSVPTSDPYTFTAQGEPWTVQSWLASVVYAGAEQAGGAIGLRSVVLAVFLVAMLVLWRLTRSAESIVVRLLLTALALFVCTDLWSERPYMIGVIGLGVLWLALEGTWRPWLLVPFLWVWVNTHGSFVLGLGLVVTVALGRALDAWATEGRFRVAERDRAVFGWVLVGTLVGAIGPLGARALTFPLTALDKADVFAEIVEWRAPTFRSVPERAFVVLVVVAVLALVRAGTWRLAVPAVVFTAAALVAQRNVVMATVVLVPVIAECAPRVGTLRSDDRPGVGRAAAAILVVPFALTSLLALLSPVDAVEGYPTTAVAWLAGADVAESARLAAPLTAGNFFEVLDGPTGEVFADDRVDMLPEAVFADVLELERAGPKWSQVLDDRGIDLVLWERREPLAALLIETAAWQIRYQDAAWVVACRREACSPA